MPRGGSCSRSRAATAVAEPFVRLGRTGAACIDRAAAQGVGRGAALALHRALHRAGRCDDPRVARPPGEVVRRQEEGATRKFALRFADGLEAEAVVIPRRGAAGRLRSTLCLSSQVGCAMGCVFCETARMGRVRQLDAEEILAQWFAARFVLGAETTGVVFMGMGEPMDNLDAVLPSIEALVDHDGPAIPAGRITISTVGRVEGIDRLTEFARRPGLAPLRLAVSLNAPDDAIRSALMPVNRADPMARLRDAMERWIAAAPRRRVLVEYVLIPGENDADAHADEVAAWLADMPAVVNVIPYNPRRDSPWPAPEEASVARFVRRLAERGATVRRRGTTGRSVMAACGQLGNPALRRSRPVPLTSTGRDDS